MPPKTLAGPCSPSAFVHATSRQEPYLSTIPVLVPRGHTSRSRTEVGVDTVTDHTNEPIR